MTDPVAPTPESISHAVSVLRGSGLVAFPTETVYGLGADARSSAAVRRIYEVKGRPSNNPLIVHIPSPDAIPLYADLSRSFDRSVVEDRLRKLHSFWPGPLSVVLPASSAIAPEVRAGGATVALRVPAHPVALELLEALEPLAREEALPLVPPLVRELETPFFRCPKCRRRSTTVRNRRSSNWRRSP